MMSPRSDSGSGGWVIPIIGGILTALVTGSYLSEATRISLLEGTLLAAGAVTLLVGVGTLIAGGVETIGPAVGKVVWTGYRKLSWLALLLGGLALSATPFVVLYLYDGPLWTWFFGYAYLLYFPALLGLLGDRPTSKRDWPARSDWYRGLTVAGGAGLLHWLADGSELVGLVVMALAAVIALFILDYPFAREQRTPFTGSRQEKPR